MEKHYLDHRKRLRERFKRTGGQGLEEYEALELLLTYVIPRRDVKPLAKRLIKHFGSVSKVFDARQKELEQFPGLGNASAILFKLVKELFILYTKDEMMEERDVLSSPESVIKFLRAKLAGLHNEAFLTVFLNVKNEVIANEIISEGTVNRVVVFPRKIIESALHHNASRVILVHNHPSGKVKPSDEDKKLTEIIVNATKALDIKVLDHIVVGKEGHFSFVENNLMPQA